jgi:hypothetical protein
MQTTFDIIGYLNPVRLGYIWSFATAVGAGLLVGILLGYWYRKARWPMGVLAGIAAFILELVYQRVIFSHEEPADYQGSALQYGELGLTFIIFILVGSALEILLRSSVGKLIKSLIEKLFK